jgi:hypothetical protein
MKLTRPIVAAVLRIKTGHRSKDQVVPIKNGQRRQAEYDRPAASVFPWPSAEIPAISISNTCAMPIDPNWDSLSNDRPALI